VFFVHQRHLVDAAVAGGASDAFVDVDTVIEVYKIGKVVDASPFQRFAGAETRTNGFQHFSIGPNLRVTTHADFGGRDAREGGRLNRGVAVAAIDAVVAHMMLVAERNGLFFDDLNIGDVVPTIHRVGKGEEQTRSE